MNFFLVIHNFNNHFGEFVVLYKQEFKALQRKLRSNKYKTPFNKYKNCAVLVPFIYLDGEYQGNALLAYEPETGGIEILFVFETFVSVNGMIVDGERFKDQWLDREVGVYTLEQLLNEDKKTSKVETVELFLQSMLL